MLLKVTKIDTNIIRKFAKTLLISPDSDKLEQYLNKIWQHLNKLLNL